ncbi:MAG: hypothetical protein FJ308_22050 [Planctomycetes bacterium]|nr:hypothetical protein [Planctomycetota bacterium]
MSKQFLLSGSLLIMRISPIESDEVLFQRVREVSDAMDELDAACKKYPIVVLTVDGFDKDPRELWHIPRAVQTIKRACKAGFLSILHPSVLMGLPSGLVPVLGGMKAFGAFELWLVASGKFETDDYRLEINRDDALRFLKKEIPSENVRLRERIAKWRSESGAS